MKVIALQMDVTWEDKPANFARARRLLAAAAPPAGALVALPEMFASGFSMNADKVAEPRGGETEQFLAATAQEFGICLLAGAAIRGDDGRARNKALAFSPEGKLIGFYAKMRPFTPGEEHQHYTAGQRPSVFHWNDCAVSPFVCYDIRFPEIFRAAAAAHAPQLFVIIANFPAKRIGHWMKLAVARAIENQAYVLAVNRVGQDPYYSYNGHSIIVDPQGEILADAGETEGAISAELDLANLKKYREGLPFLADLDKNSLRF